jgi:hypothetical protein
MVETSIGTQAAAAGAVVAATVGTTAAPGELNAIEAKLSLYLHEVETRYEADVAKVKSTFSALKANVGKLLASHVVAGGLGAVVSAIVKHYL